MPSQRTSSQRNHNSNEANAPSDARSPQVQIDQHVLEIQRRQFAYAFGGSEESWCAPGSDSPQIELPIIRDGQSDLEKAGRFTGCLKYRTCHLVPEEIKWRRWEDLQESEREQLRSIGCYRASRPGWDWDPSVLLSRKARPVDARWIANPFGIRTPELKEKADEIESGNGDVREHRDLWPCPLGGCVTPEMQRDYQRASDQIDPRQTTKSWGNTAACPFFFRHTDADLTVAIKNSQRFAQCYLTLADLRHAIKQTGLVVAAPIIRAMFPSASGESYWYSFYSGFSFLQFPARYPQAEGRDPLFPFRWVVTTLARLQTEPVHRRPPIGDVFEEAETGHFLTSWERSQRIVSISDGQATSFLLQWVLLRRLRALVLENGPSSGFLDLTQRVTWSYEPSPGVVARLADLGFATELNRLHLTIAEGGGSNRYATLLEDFSTLGLLKDANGLECSDRVRHCMAWLGARIDTSFDNHPIDSLDTLIRKWLAPACSALGSLRKREIQEAHTLDFLADICICLTRSAGIDLRAPNGNTPVGWAGLQKVIVPDMRDLPERLVIFEREIFDKVCRLVPTVHFLVRAEMTVPLRWLFVPTAAGAETSQTPTTVHSGLIVLIEDELTSSPYRTVRFDQDDTVLRRLYEFLPILILAASIEEEHVRSEYILGQGQWAVQRDQFEWLRHLLKTIRNSLTPSEGCDAKYVQALLETLQQSLVVLPERRQLSAPDAIAVPAIPAATAALDVFLAFYGKRKNTDATLIYDCPPNTSVRITPLSQTYRNEKISSRTQRATSDFTLLILDMLIQRADAGESQITCHLSYDASKRTTSIALQLEHPVDDSWLWDSTKSLDFWERGRGFYLTFAISRAVGSTRQVVENINNRGIIKLEFQSEL